MDDRLEKLKQVLELNIKGMQALSQTMQTDMLSPKSATTNVEQKELLEKELLSPKSQSL